MHILRYIYIYIYVRDQKVFSPLYQTYRAGHVKWIFQEVELYKLISVWNVKCFILVYPIDYRPIGKKTSIFDSMITSVIPESNHFICAPVFINRHECVDFTVTPTSLLIYTKYEHSLDMMHYNIHTVIFASVFDWYVYDCVIKTVSTIMRSLWWHSRAIVAACCQAIDWRQPLSVIEHSITARYAVLV